MTPDAVDQAMRHFGLSRVVRAKNLRTTIPGKDGQHAGDLLNHNSIAITPDKVRVSDFTYVRSWAGFAYTASIPDVFSQRNMARHCTTTTHVDPVQTPATDGFVGPRKARPSRAPR